jgi:tetratricopeptide (TPR) repeat protein
LYHLWLGNALDNEAQQASKFRQPFLARRVKTEFERAVGLDPSMIDARVSLIDFYVTAPGFLRGSIEKAKLQAAAIAKLSALQGRLATARIARVQHDTVTEERENQNALTVALDSAGAYFALGAFYRNHSRPADAFAIYDRLMKRRPDEMAAHLTWAGTAAVSGKNLERGEREAKFYLASAKDAPPVNSANAHWRLGQIYASGARIELARSEYQQSLRINPHNEAVKKLFAQLK